MCRRRLCGGQGGREGAGERGRRGLGAFTSGQGVKRLHEGAATINMVPEGQVDSLTRGAGKVVTALVEVGSNITNNSRLANDLMQGMGKWHDASAGEQALMAPILTACIKVRWAKQIQAQRLDGQVLCTRRWGMLASAHELLLRAS